MTRTRKIALRGIAALIAVLALAACGADGEPETPTRAPVEISISGSAGLGLTGRF